MSQSPQVIELLGGIAGHSVHSEAISAAGSAIAPGHLVERTTADEVQEHSTAATNAEKLFALTDLPVGGTISDVYAVGSRVRFGAFHSGQEVYARVAASATAITNGAALESAGDGTLRIQTAAAATSEAARDSVVGYALEAVDNSGGGTEVFIRVRVA